ncbi:MAG: VOC family protein [Candidatus Hermodarchaeia archaeon]|jgi:predicted enzyme related to lactoylglutathione lyase
MPRVIDFEIPADDVERITKFYKTSEPGINGSFAKRGDFPEGTTVNVIGVDNVDKYAKLVKTNGGKLIGDKITIPRVGYYRYFKDTEGNLMGMMQYDSSAK